ncbi:uncharacterized protein LACBIDRAFT_304015 [Laccaria bicolor S238N-H82]|uniref:Predicted protein n=1 Tax=Laccaria bicolor (strain S238N-H82 / ATCC MYA-4686) TaxID=486041 RepID=B0DKS0_LACBS|nr:uncharacterized protein LACBIDRAFT_304015 [Laccaria bicolor S238N-H82]EDR04694.1 predicted protein [Laccaria bicolor S238N-H82]|eukprot:XP_001884518.1 predicted protein [Laccaria bicolor S238N-H82]
MIANAVVDIWRAEGVFPVPKYEDDLKAFRFPSPLGPFVDGEFTSRRRCPYSTIKVQHGQLSYGS